MQQQPQQPPRQMPTNVTTEQIQKYLDENKQLILAILENQNLGKLSECAAYQAQLQKNLLFLAAIADSQPQISPPSQSQMMPNGATPPQGGFFAQQAPMFPPRPPLNFNPQAIQEQQQHQMPHLPPQVAHFQGNMGARPGLINKAPSSSADNRGNKHDAGTPTSEGGVSSGGAEHRVGDGDSAAPPRRLEDGGKVSLPL